MTITAPPIDPAAHVSPELFDRLVQRVAEDEGVDAEHARRIVDETLVFLAACATRPDARMSPSPAVDAGWHAFILHTHDYALFCNRLAGRFIHHRPTGPDDTSGATVADTVELIRQAGFGVNEELWNLEGKCRKDCEQGPKCHQCHAGCHDSP